jgi:hypothetical protein
MPVRGARRVDCRGKCPKLPNSPRGHIGGPRTRSQSRRATFRSLYKLGDTRVLPVFLTWRVPLGSFIFQYLCDRFQVRSALADVDSGNVDKVRCNTYAAPNPSGSKNCAESKCRLSGTRDQAKADVFDYIECFYNAKLRYVPGIAITETAQEDRDQVRTFRSF